MIKVTMIGLDTSHSISFTHLMQAPECQEKVEGIKVVSCLRFPSAFQSEEGQDERQKQLEQWGVKVTRDIKEALEGAEAIMLEINDPALHLKYFKKVMDAGKPIFLDKPPADTLENAKEIFRLAKERNLRIFSCSSLRFAPEVIQLAQEIAQPKIGMALGPLGQAPAGSSIVWYGVHTVEMLQKIMGRGAKKVFSRKDKLGVVGIIEYSDGRRGIVQLNEGDYRYGVFAQDKKIKYLNIDTSHLYFDQLKEIKGFFEGKEVPVSPEDTLEIQAILNAMEESISTNKEVLL